MDHDAKAREIADESVPPPDGWYDRLKRDQAALKIAAALREAAEAAQKSADAEALCAVANMAGNCPHYDNDDQIAIWRYAVEACHKRLKLSMGEERVARVALEDKREKIAYAKGKREGAEEEREICEGILNALILEMEKLSTEHHKAGKLELSIRCGTASAELQRALSRIRARSDAPAEKPEMDHKGDATMYALGPDCIVSAAPLAAAERAVVDTGLRYLHRRIQGRLCDSSWTEHIAALRHLDTLRAPPDPERKAKADMARRIKERIGHIWSDYPPRVVEIIDEEAAR